MNDEYLWHKTGEDPEIEKLEKALSVFRYKDATISVPAADLVTERLTRWRISFAYAFAFASLLIVATLGVAWLQVSSNGSNSEKTDDVVFVQQTADAPDSNPVVEPKLLPAANSERHDRPTGTRRRSINRTSAAFRPRPKVKDLAPREGVAELTREERFAYRQLMIALSITGSKLKVVQDAIDGTEDTEGNADRNQR